MQKQHTNKNEKIGKPLVIRLYQDQRERLDDFIREANKALVNKGLPPKNSSEYVRLIFDIGMDELDV